MSNIRILGISGSLRKASHNRGLIRAAQALFPSDVTFEIGEIGDLPHFSEDLEPDFPAEVRSFRDSIERADAVLIALTEYNHSISGVLKNAIDWASRPPKMLRGKRLFLMGAATGESGTIRAHEHMVQISFYPGMVLDAGVRLFVQRSRGKFDSDGNLIDEATREQLRKLVDHIIATVRAAKS